MRSLFIMLSVAVLACFGQAGKATLSGAVDDPSGLPVSGAQVQAEEQSTRASFPSTTNESGQYRLLGLRPGEYVLTVKQPGFKTYRQSGIILRIEDRTIQNVRLEVGQPAQTVDVIASAPLLQTATGELSFHVDRTKITTLPLDGRNFIPLLTLSPGVALPGAGSVLARINGSRPRTNEYIFDGISALQPEPGQVVFYPIIDGIEEFPLNLNAYSPEYGRSNGRTVIVNMKS